MDFESTNNNDVLGEIGILKFVSENPQAEWKATGKLLYQNVMEVLHDEPNRQVETALGIMGALAGFCCLLPIYRRYEADELKADGTDFEIISLRDGRRQFAGNRVTENLIESSDSLWSVISEAAQGLGADELPDITDITRHVADTADTARFGLPRLGEDQMPADLPVNFVRHLMPSYLPLLKIYNPDPDQFRHAIAAALELIMERHVEQVAPEHAAQIIMECAVPMARIDPMSVL